VQCVLAAAALSGCQLSHMNHESMQAVAVAAHAGQFYRVNGRWPESRTELEHFDCPAIDKAQLSELWSPDETTCGFLVALGYQIELHPHPHALGLVFLDGGRQVCRLSVDAPGADSGTALAPMMTIHTSVFSCPGNGESFK